METFDRPLARLLLEICRYTYAKNFEIINEVSDSLNWINEHAADYTDDSLKLLIGSNTSVACVFRYPDKNIVSYMGTKTEFNNPSNATQSIADWFKNFKVEPVSFHLSAEQLGLTEGKTLGGNVHKGFLSELQEVQAEVVKVLMANGGKEKSLYVTGHSQGGAEATLATRAFQEGGFNVKAAYTFAAPRSGNKEYASQFRTDIPFHRIEFGDDIVPHAPPTLLSKTAQGVITKIKTAQQKILAERSGFGKLISYIKSMLPGQSELSTEKFIAILEKFTTDVGFVSVGHLCYGNNATKMLRVDMSAAEEAAIFDERLLHLLKHPKDWAEHHHLAGTKEEFNAHHKGNYTALISDFQLSND